MLVFFFVVVFVKKIEQNDSETDSNVTSAEKCNSEGKKTIKR